MKRMIDDSFFTNEKIGQASPRWRLFLVGLIANADDQGRLSANYALLRAKIMPFDDISFDEIKEILEWLESIGTVLLYERNGKACLQLVEWWRYQKWLQFAMPSNLPPPDGWKDRIRRNVGRSGKNSIVTYNWKGGKDTCDADGVPLVTPSSAKKSTTSPPPPPPPPPESDPVDAFVKATVPTKAVVDYQFPAVSKPTSTSTSVTTAAKILTRVAKLCEVPRATFVNGKIPANTGTNGLLVYYEFVSAYDVVLGGYNADRLRDITTRLDKLRTALACWLGANNQPGNVTGILDWMKNGVPNHAKSATNGAGVDVTPKSSLGVKATLDHAEAASVFANMR